MFEFLRGETTRVVEAHLPMNQSHDELRGHLRKALSTAEGGDTSQSYYADMPWITDVFPKHVVYSHKGSSYRRSYTAEFPGSGKDPKVTLGEKKPVHRAYVETKDGANMEAESFFFTDDTTPVAEPTPKPKESVTRYTPDGSEVVFESAELLSVVKVKEASSLSKIPVKIIAAGWGSMAYYPKEVLQRDGPKVYKAGTHMFWNHATEAEEQQRPEGDLSNLAAVLTKDAEWKESGAKGPGLYAEAKVFSDYAQQVSEKGAHMGLSINAAIRGKEGEREGRRGKIAERLVHAFSVDFVTKAGAGGAPVVPVQESAGDSTRSTTMTEQETQAAALLTKENNDLKVKLAELEAGQNQILAVATVGTVLREAGIPVNRGLLERVCATPVVKEGKIDPEWVKVAVKDLSAGHEGRIKGFGEIHESDGDLTDTTDEKVQERLKKTLTALGVPEKGLDFAVAGRV